MPKRRQDSTQKSEKDAIAEARKKAGDTGQSDWENIEDPETGEIIGRRSPDGKQEWRIDRKGHPEYDEPPHIKLEKLEERQKRGRIWTCLLLTGEESTCGAHVLVCSTHAQNEHAVKQTRRMLYMRETYAH